MFNWAHARLEVITWADITINGLIEHIVGQYISRNKTFVNDIFNSLSHTNCAVDNKVYKRTKFLYFIFIFPY